MTEFFLENHRIFLPESTVIKLKLENVYFTQSGEYSLDVEIPLIGNHNNAIAFRHIHRQDVKKEVRALKARLIAGNIVIMDGTATITGITDTSVKVQLLAGNAELNFQSNSNSLYIDELDLGKIKHINNSNVIESNGVFLDIAHISSETERYKRLFGLYGETDYVCFPIYDESKSKIYNDMCIRVIGQSTYTIFLPENVYTSTQSVDKINLWSFSSKSHCAPQPYFCFIIRRIFEALGYTVAENQIEQTKLRNIFICNSRPTLILNEMMPHWTVNEFLTQLENFFGVIIAIDSVKKSVRILLRNEYFVTEVSHIDQVNDEYSVTCEEDETTDISNGNIGYEFGDVDPYLKIDNSIMEKVVTKDFNTYQDLVAYYNNLSTVEKAKYLYSCSGKQYIHYAESTTKSYLREVNQFRNLIRNSKSDSLDIELKIVPASMDTNRIKWEGVAYESFFKHYYSTEGVTLNAVMIHVAGNEAVANDEFCIQDAIDGDVTTESTKSRIEVAMNDGVMQTVTTDDGKRTHDFPWPFVLTSDPLLGENNRGFSLELNEVAGRNTMYNAVYGHVILINTQSEIVYKFISNKTPNVGCRFIINNKTYVCKMIEYSVDHEGKQEEKTGYFYEYGV